MFDDTSPPRRHVCPACSAAVPSAAHFCPQCAALLPLGRAVDYFAFLGVPRKLRIDPTELERRFRSLSRQLHPDYFANAPASVRRASLERSSYLNDAYRTLKSPPSRVEYLLRLTADAGGNGGAMAASSAVRSAPGQVPAALLEDVFALNEELEAVRELKVAGAPRGLWQPRLDAARRPIEMKRDTHEMEMQALFSAWDNLVDAGVPESDPRAREVLRALGERMLERNYIVGLLANFG